MSTMTATRTAQEVRSGDPVRECSHKSPHRNPVTRTCEWCGEDYVRPSCWPKSQRFCTKWCSRKWKDEHEPGRERSITVGGYRRIRTPDGRRTTEHRYVMEQMLGRRLLSSEQVHHIDGDKLNNAPENLQLRINPHGAGAVYCCANCGSSNLVPKEL